MQIRVQSSCSSWRCTAASVIASSALQKQELETLDLASLELASGGDGDEGAWGMFTEMVGDALGGIISTQDSGDVQTGAYLPDGYISPDNTGNNTTVWSTHPSDNTPAVSYPNQGNSYYIPGASWINIDGQVIQFLGAEC